MQPLTSAQMDFLWGLFGRERVNAGPSAQDLHCRDYSFHACQRPAVVVWPRSTEEVSRLLAWADAQLVPITPWGVGSSVEGNPIPVKGGVVADLTLMDKLVRLFRDDMQVEVEPGLTYKDLNTKLRHEGLFFPPDPGAAATLGGMIANNASGTRTVKYGATRDYVQGLVVVLAGGQVIHTGNRAHKSSSGYDLTRLFVGSEGTLGVITRAWLRLAGLPEHFAAVVASFESVEQAVAAVVAVKASGTAPAALELITAPLAKLMRAEGLDIALRPQLFMEFDGFSPASLAEALSLVEEICRELGCVDFAAGQGTEEHNRLWSARHAVAESIKRTHPGLEMLVTDAAVPISSYPALVAFAYEHMRREGVTGYVLGHAGDGNLHVVWPGDPGDAEGWRKVEAANEAIVAEAIRLEGTATGEHGVGIGKIKFMAQEHGQSLAVMRAIKRTLDPRGILNPGKLLPEA
jgi:D-lactate dehydrogenase (cytochrome)